MISVGKLAEKGVRAVFSVYGNTVVAVADKVSDMYWLRIAQDRVIKSEAKEQTYDDPKIEDSSTESVEMEWYLDETKREAKTNVANDTISESEFYGWDCSDNGWPQGFWNNNDNNWIRRLWDDDDAEAGAAVPETAGVPPVRYDEEVYLVKESVAEPNTYKEAVSGLESAEWKSAMAEEMQSHQENGTWELAELPPHRKAIGSKWIFKCKADEDGHFVRYKARLVAQGFCQKFRTDYDLVFAPVVKQITYLRNHNHFYHEIYQIYEKIHIFVTASLYL